MPNTCATCRHFLKIPASRSVHTECVGECRNGPPVADWKWPKVRDVDYCSEFEGETIAFATVAPDTKPGAIIPVPAADTVLFAAPIPSAPAPAPAPVGELPLSLDAGQTAPTPPDAAKTPAADAPGTTRPRSAKASPKTDAPAPSATGPAGVE